MPVERVRTWRSSSAADAHAFGGERDARARFGARHVVHGRKETQIFPGAQTSVETLVAAGVVAKLAPRAGGMAFDVAIGDRRAAARGKNQCGENAEQRGLSRAIRPDDCYSLCRVGPKRKFRRVRAR